ncbi:putative metallopeptidase [Gluconacetobacter diazotrophicus PA1 5]|uniref:Putative metallopeptidase n=2 Tax=Gluconacetobacter diazotrophicus TaxID=33996 RepID=A9HRE6_GLUDA|nr:putative metallopeptidase [Gluconacetobacter diazotrophicus PA1 5]
MARYKGSRMSDFTGYGSGRRGGRARASLLCGTAFLVAAGLLASGGARAADIAQTSAAKEPAAPSYGTWGFDMAGRDTAIVPGNDFFGYANGRAVHDIVIPPDMTAYGPFNMLHELSRQRVQTILRDLSAHPVAQPVTVDQKLGTFYSTFMDEQGIESLGVRPLAPGLDAIRAVDTRTAFAALLGRAQSGFQYSLFGLGIQPDAKDPTVYALTLDQAGIGLPDRDYYLKPAMAAKKTAYQAYVRQILTMIQWPDAAKMAPAIVAFETRLAGAHWARQDMRDPDRTYNPITVSDLRKRAPGFDWAAYLTGAELPPGIVTSGTLIVGEPDAVVGEARIASETDLATLRAWLAFHLVDNAARYLPRAFVQASFDFNDKTLGGQPQLPERWKRGVTVTSSAMGMALGQTYVARYFPPAYRDTMRALTGELKAAFRVRLQHNEWMGPQTRAAALQKLDHFTIQIGYPNRWRDYSTLPIRQGDAYGNAERAVAFEWRYWLGHLGHPVDRDEWDMTPQTVNAYNNPLFNEVVFPAAILQPPFFNPKADPAINYGAIGGVIGHEMTHSFDDEGRKFDYLGRLKEWWTKDDAARFDKLAARFGAQYDAFQVLPGVHVNGKLTMGENIADLGGLTLALDAYHASLHGKPAPVIGGLTGDQRVFLGWAQVWRQKMRDDTVRARIMTDPHSPPQARVNLPMHNIDAWYRAWNVKPGDTLYLKPEARVKIW